MTFLLIYTIWNASPSQTKPISWQCSYCCCCSISHYYLLQLFSIWGFNVSLCTFWYNVILMLEPASSLGPIGKESVASMAATIKKTASGRRAKTMVVAYYAFVVATKLLSISNSIFAHQTKSERMNGNISIGLLLVCLPRKSLTRRSARKWYCESRRYKRERAHAQQHY